MTVYARELLAGRSLYLCVPARPDVVSFVGACIAGGVDVVQLREKSLEARAIIRIGRELVGLCRDLGVPFIMNDRADLALEVDADGVHVGQDDVSPLVARRILGEHRIVGLSTHAPAELVVGIDEPVDYLAAGPVVPTATHPDRAPTGLGYIEQASKAAGKGRGDGPLPLFVTGGVTPESVPGLVASGARRFVVVRYLTEADDPAAAARALRHAIDDSLLATPG